MSQSRKNTYQNIASHRENNKDNSNKNIHKIIIQKRIKNNLNRLLLRHIKAIFATNIVMYN